MTGLGIWVNVKRASVRKAISWLDVERRVNSIVSLNAKPTKPTGIVPSSMPHANLDSLGIDEYLLAETDEDRRITLAQQVKQLVLPSAMGESFKVLALTKKLSVKLKGFTEQDLTHKL